MKVTDRGVKYPVTPGHEIVGSIAKMGIGVTGFSEGDDVLVYPWIGEGTCPACKAGNENLCDSPKSLGVFQDGGYAEQVLVPHFKYLVKGSGNAVQKILSICDNKGVDSVIDFVNAPQTAKTGIAILRKRGNLVLVGLFGGSIDLSLVTIPLKAITIQGAYTGNYNDFVELIELAKKGTIKQVISERYSLNQSNDALENLKQRKIIGRAVINP